MAVQNKIDYAKLKDLWLDPTNPRLGRHNTSRHMTQDAVLEIMNDWSLEELASSFLESGFWPQEALLVVEELLGGQTRKVVVEGNRRLAALKMLKLAFDGHPDSKLWRELVARRKEPEKLFLEIPYILINSRKDVVAFLGFRHVTGIKEWNPAEKAEYIADLIEEHKMSYDEVRKKIGSKTDTVRRNYISYRLLLQMEGEDDIDLERVEDKFSVLYLSLRSLGVQRYLQIDIQAEPSHAKRPVPTAKITSPELQHGGNQRPTLFACSCRSPPDIKRGLCLSAPISPSRGCFSSKSQPKLSKANWMDGMFTPRDGQPRTPHDSSKS
jgi:ParB-like chromosome segregation protein Spo0J